MVTNTVISTTMFAALLADLATSFSTCLCKDGQSTPTANLPMGGYKITGLGAPTVSGDALSFGAVATITTLTLTNALTVANGGTGVATLTGIVKGAGTAAFAAAAAGTDYAKPDTASTWSAKQTFNGAAASLAVALKSATEPATVSATAATGTIAYNILSQSVLYYTSNAVANWTVNLRGDGSTTLASLLATGDMVTVVFEVTNGATPFFNSAVQVDGTATGVTTKWQGAVPAAGNASAIDVYTYSILKTAATPTYTVFASVTPFV